MTTCPSVEKLRIWRSADSLTGKEWTVAFYKASKSRAY